MKLTYLMKFKTGRIKECTDNYENIINKYGNKILWIDIKNGVNK